MAYTRQNFSDGQTLTAEHLNHIEDGIKAIDSRANDINCKIIAHRGYHANYPQNTIAAFIDAINNGFTWLEIDIRKTTDGFYVMSHDDSVTLYNKGNAVTVKISTSKYADIKSYTWDKAGVYIINTLQAVFNALKTYNAYFICDLKNGTNEDIAQLAALCGMTDRIMLSYSGPTTAIKEAALLKKYDNVAIRVIPTNYPEMISLAEKITNKIYCDVNASMSYHTNNYLPFALASGFPILFSGCTLQNKTVWAAVASGCMSNDDLNITYSQYVEALQGKYDAISTISVSQDELEIDFGETVNVTAISTLKSTSGNIYAYSKDNSVCKVVQKTFGNSINFDIVCVTIGSTEIVVFDGVGNIFKIPVTIAAEEVPAPELGVVSNVNYVVGASLNGTDGKAFKNDARMMATVSKSNIPIVVGDNAWSDTKYAIEIPAEATKIVITCPNHIVGIMLCTTSSTGAYTVAKDTGWQTANAATYEFEAGKYGCVVLNYKNSSNNDISKDVDTSGFSIEFQ